MLFTNEIVDYLDSLGKKAIVWNEVADKRLDNRTTAQFWRGSFDPIISFLEEGGSTIISPARYYYVNMAYHTISLNEAYQYEPLPIDISKRFKENILGIEAELWGEVIKSEEKAEYCAFPRVLAIAETAWTQPEHKNLKRILKSIKQFEPILEKMNIKYTSLKEANPSGLRTFINRWKKGFGAYL